MTKNQNTKRALLTSVLSLMLCAAMLIGSTFAWFTDSVTSGKNRIVAGNLDVELEYKNPSTGDGWQNATIDSPKFFVNQTGGNILWEPGVVAVTQFKVANMGSLALQYKLETINADSNKFGEHDLSEVIKIAVVDGAQNFENREAVEAAGLEFNDFTKFAAEGHLLPAEHTEDIFTVVAYWAPGSDDDFYNLNNGQTASDGEDQLYIDIEIHLTATQFTHENDGFGNDYDVAAGDLLDPFAEADAAALAANPMRAYRTPDGSYGIISSNDEPSFLLNIASKGQTATLIRPIGAPVTYFSSTQANYSNKNSVLDLNRKTYTFGGLELKPNGGVTAANSSLVIKNGTMVGSTTTKDMLHSNNAMQSVTLDNVTMKWNTPRAWDVDKNNYRGLNLSTNISGSVFTVLDSLLDCNARFHVTNRDLTEAERPIVNITNTVVNGRLAGQGLIMNVEGCTVNGEVYCSSVWSSKTTVNIRNSTVNGNAYFDASKDNWALQWNEVTIENTTINGNLQTNFSRNNVHITLINATVTGTLSYSNSPIKIPADKVTIVSGTFGFNPTNYLDTGSTATDNGNGTWTVTAG